MRVPIEALEQRVLNGGEVTGEEAQALMSLAGRDVYDLFPSANRIARRFKGWVVELCGIVNAKSGRCPEDCAFCAQSAHHRTDTPVYDLMEVPAVVKAAAVATSDGADHFGIVTSGTRVRGAQLDVVCEAIGRIVSAGQVIPCASLGILDAVALGRLKTAGLRRYHHNLETSRSFFPTICSTHEYDDDVATVVAARNVGLEVCSGGIFGVGESPAQRVELALTLRELGADSVPINFLVPVPGTRLEGRPALSPLEALQIVAVFRFVLPRATLKVCAGRERNLGDMASWIFYAGANAMMVGNFLTTAGRTPELDLAMIRALGFSPVSEVVR
jgi:biotin synthase